jgi:hypothetical protein
MKYQLSCSITALAIGLALSPFTTHAQLRITEVESSEAPVGTNAPHADWWELTNLGSNPVDITGFRMDDNSASFALSVPLSGITSISAGESAVFFEVTGNPPLTVQGFRDWWGLGSSVQVGTYSGSGVGLSSASDAVNLYTSTGTLVDGVSFGAATTGTTFGWDPVAQTFGGLSQIGVNGAYAAPQNGDIGSPGVVPEPGTFALVLTGLAALGFSQRYRKNGR